MSEATLTGRCGQAAAVPKLLFTPREAAKALGLCEKTIWSLTEPRGPIPAVRVGRAVRYDPRDLSAWIDQAKARKTCENGE